MATDPEPLIRLEDVPKLKWLPLKNGKRIHVATVYRWAQRGVGGVRLETVRVGGTKCTTVSALERFFRRCDDPGAPMPSPCKSDTRVESKLRQIGLL